MIEEIELEGEEEEAEKPAEVAGEEVLEAALAPEVDTARPGEEAAHAAPLGEETIEAIVADLKRRQAEE